MRSMDTFCTKVCGFALGSVFMSVAAGWAETQGAWEFGVGPEAIHIEYREPGIMKETGFMTGAEGYARVMTTFLRYELSASYVFGDLEYVANPSQYSARSLEFTTSGGILDLRGVAGYPLQMWDCPALIFAGLGHRVLSDKIPDVDPFPGYAREETYDYLPVGLRIGFSMAEQRQLDLGIEFDMLLQGRNKTAGVHMTQHSGFGCRVMTRYRSPALAFGILPDMGFFVEPFFQYWNVDKSDETSQGWYEPKNESTSFGLCIGACF